MTSKVQSSKVASLARAKNDGSDTRVSTRPRRPTPPPWSPSARSAFSRPTAPPLAEVSLDTVTKAVPMPTRETTSVRIVAPASGSANKPAPATLPPPPVGTRKTKPAPDTLPPPPGIAASVYVRPVPVMPMPGPAMPAARSIRPAMAIPVALGEANDPTSVVMMTAVGASKPVAAVAKAQPVVATPKVETRAKVAERVEAVEVVEAVEAPVVVPVVPSMVETSPIAVGTPELSGPIVVSEEELEELFAEEPEWIAPVAAPIAVVEAAVVEAGAPMVEIVEVPQAEIVALPVAESAFAPIAVERCDSVPLIVLASSMTSSAPALEVEAPQRRASVIVMPPASATPTLDARVVRAMASSHAPARPSRRRIGLVLGAAASLLLAIGIAASAGSSPTDAREDLLLTASMEEPAALVKAWMARTQTSEPAAVPTMEMVQMVEPTADAAPLPSGGELLAVASPTEVIEPALEPSSEPRRSRRARRTRAEAPVAVEAASEPTPEPTRTSTRKPRAASAKQMLWDGEVALALGDAKEAYRLARRSRDTGASSEAASLVARSACRIGERDEAKKALRDMPLLERGAVRRDCRRSGSRIGL